MHFSNVWGEHRRAHTHTPVHTYVYLARRRAWVTPLWRIWEEEQFKRHDPNLSSQASKSSLRDQCWQIVIQKHESACWKCLRNANCGTHFGHLGDVLKNNWLAVGTCLVPTNTFWQLSLKAMNQPDTVPGKLNQSQFNWWKRKHLHTYKDIDYQ